MSKIIASVNNVWKIYPPNVEALRGVSMEIKEGDFVAIVGRSGSGKSTLLHLLGLMDSPTKGKALFLGRDVAKMSEEDKSHLRAFHIGFLFQAFNLLPELNAVENVALQAMICGFSEAEARKKAEGILASLGMQNRLYHNVTKLSGGEKQRVGLARALVIDTDLILADEPTGEVDTKTRDDILNLLTEINRRGKTLVLVTHDVKVAEYAKKRIRLEDGRIVHRS
jgi:putative ABC transport system ATP-binding protein